MQSTTAERKKLTKRQQDIFNYITKFQGIHLMSPSLQEIADGCKISKPRAQNMVDRIVKLGYFTKNYRGYIALPSSPQNHEHPSA